MNQNPEIKQDLINNLPSEIMIDILSRLSIETTMKCKFVCKSWMNLVNTLELVNSHHSKSVPHLIVYEFGTWKNPYKIFEFVDELDHEHPTRRGTKVLSFNFPHPQPVHSSVKGLLFMCNLRAWPYDLFVCNPITRDYIKIPSPHLESSSRFHTFGFGVSKISGFYKLVRIFHPRANSDLPKCEVYTLGTGVWRSIAASSHVEYMQDAVGAFVNGNLHWLVYDSNGRPWISCLDLETELFSWFSPPLPPGSYNRGCLSFSVLGDCLCLCNNSDDDEIDIWLMKEYGDEKSWTREILLDKWSDNEFCGLVFPIKVFKDGDILMTSEGQPKLVCYSTDTQAIEKEDLFGFSGYYCNNAVIFTPSFYSVIKTFVMENVGTF